jgi:hypothetical protein
MPVNDERNVLKVGPDERATYDEITQAMVEAVRGRIEAAGGSLVVWAILNEDTYETRYGDGYYVHVQGLALNPLDAQCLADMAGDSEHEKWTVQDYRLVIENGLPALAEPWTKAEEFRIGDFVAILSEIPPGGTASKLLTGSGLRKDGPFIELPGTDSPS